MVPGHPSRRVGWLPWPEQQRGCGDYTDTLRPALSRGALSRAGFGVTWAAPPWERGPYCSLQCGCPGAWGGALVTLAPGVFGDHEHPPPAAGRKPAREATCAKSTSDAALAGPQLGPRLLVTDVKVAPCGGHTGKLTCRRRWPRGRGSLLTRGRRPVEEGSTLQRIVQMTRAVPGQSGRRPPG